METHLYGGDTKKLRLRAIFPIPYTRIFALAKIRVRGTIWENPPAA